MMIILAENSEKSKQINGSDTTDVILQFQKIPILTQEKSILSIKILIVILKCQKKWYKEVYIKYITSPIGISVCIPPTAYTVR